MSRMCPTCHLCMTCSDSRPDHDCPYPDCDKWHLCPNRTAESNASARSRARAEDKTDPRKDDLEF